MAMLNPEITEKIITFLSENYPKDFNIQDIADAIEIHRNTVSTYLKVLVAEGTLKVSRKIGRIRLYTIATKQMENN
ncbi:MAG: HTH domain-containing protein [Candidatus Lokiarchaeota archaeon]|nr:HTH domain-containing protein [Candidatus Lokiarchaeota archaeon]